MQSRLRSVGSISAARTTLPFVVALGLALFATPSHVGAEELSQLLRMTRDHPAVAGGIAEANAAGFDVDAARAASRFQVGVGLGSAGYSNQTGNRSEWLMPYVSASKLIYDHGRTKAEVQGREAAHAGKLAHVQLQRESINKQLTMLYATALGHRLAGEVIDEQVAALKDLRDRVATIVRIDPGRASEANQVESRLASAMANREARVVAEREAWQQVTQILQRDVALSHELPNLKRLHLLPDNLVQASQTLEEHPALIEARLARDESDAAYRVATKWNRPRWTLDVRADSQRDDGNGQMQWFEGVAVEVRGNLSLFDGGAGAATAQGESQRLQAAESAVDNVRRELKQELERQWVSLPLREKQLATLDELVDVADRMRKAGEEQFFAGRRPLTDLMAFDSDFYSARLNREEQRVQYLTSQWLIVAALGRLSDMADSSQAITAVAIGDGARQSPADTVVHDARPTPRSRASVPAVAAAVVEARLPNATPQTASGSILPTVRPATMAHAATGVQATKPNALRAWPGGRDASPSARGADTAAVDAPRAWQANTRSYSVQAPRPESPTVPATATPTPKTQPKVDLRAWPWK